MDFTGAISGVTGDCTCSLEAEPQDGSVVRVLYAENELDCKISCGQEAECEFYTFLVPANDCKLLKNVSSFGNSSVEVYKTGPRDCASSNGLRSFALLDNFSDHAMMVNDSKSYSVDVRSGMMDCMINVSIVLVGSGGDSSYPTSQACYSGGGGSGFVNQTVVSLNPPVTLDLSFGNSWSSGISVSVNDEDILNATKGGDGWWEGGDGYSGGGAGLGAFGGEDGGDGACGGRPTTSTTYSTTDYTHFPPTTTTAPTTNPTTSTESQCGGKGQGIDIRQFSSPHFLLTPGPAGSDTECNNGGGGVLVNGHGPKQGTSFGMGGSHKHSPGRAVALLDIIH